MKKRSSYNPVLLRIVIAGFLLVTFSSARAECPGNTDFNAEVIWAFDKLAWPYVNTFPGSEMERKDMLHAMDSTIFVRLRKVEEYYKLFERSKKGDDSERLRNYDDSLYRVAMARLDSVLALKTIDKKKLRQISEADEQAWLWVARTPNLCAPMLAKLARFYMKVYGGQDAPALSVVRYDDFHFSVCRDIRWMSWKHFNADSVERSQWAALHYNRVVILSNRFSANPDTMEWQAYEMRALMDCALMADSGMITRLDNVLEAICSVAMKSLGTAKDTVETRKWFTIAYRANREALDHQPENVRMLYNMAILFNNYAAQLVLTGMDPLDTRVYTYSEFYALYMGKACRINPAYCQPEKKR